MIHKLDFLEDKLGPLYIGIVLDNNGYEICLVSLDTFHKAVVQATDWKDPDWAGVRKEMHAKFGLTDPGVE